MYNKFLKAALLLIIVSKGAAFTITGYLPSYRLESVERAVGSSVLDLTNHSTEYKSNRLITEQNLAYSYDSFPQTYNSSSIEDWYGRYVDEIIYFSVRPAANGSIDHSAIEERDLSRLTNLSHIYGTKLTISVSGPSDLFVPVLEKKSLRNHFIDELARFCQSYGFQGVDYDWEFPKTEEQLDLFQTLIEESKETFEPHNITVSAAVSRFKPIRKEILESLENIHLMAYDNYGRHSTYESAVEASEYLKISYEIPSEKIRLGIPFYGRIFNGQDPQYWKKTMIYKDIDEDFQPSSHDDEAGGFYFNGIETVKRKTEYARETGLGGVMIWELGQDALNERSLLKAIHEEIQ